MSGPAPTVDAAVDRLRAERRARARAALASLRKPDTSIEIRPASAESRSGWARTALTMVAAIAATAVLVGEVHAKQPPQLRDGPAREITPISWQMGLPTTPVVAQIDGRRVEAMNPLLRVQLCREVAQQEQLQRHGLGWRDIYAIVHAETGWFAREGQSKDGTPNLGVAQFEPATADALGIDPHDPKQALQGVARLLKHARAWAASRALPDAGDGYGPGGAAAHSVFYNLSTKARNGWSGTSPDELPIETQRHISNYRDGLKVADLFGKQYDRLAASLQHTARLRERVPRWHEIDDASAPDGPAARQSTSKPAAVARSAPETARVAARAAAPAPAGPLPQAATPAADKPLAVQWREKLERATQRLLASAHEAVDAVVAPPPDPHAKHRSSGVVERETSAERPRMR